MAASVSAVDLLSVCVNRCSVAFPCVLWHPAGSGTDAAVENGIVRNVLICYTNQKDFFLRRFPMNFELDNTVLSYDMDRAINRILDDYNQKAIARYNAEHQESPYRFFTEKKLMRYIIGLYALEHCPLLFYDEEYHVELAERTIKVLERRAGITKQEILERMMQKDIERPCQVVIELLEDVYIDVMGHEPCKEDFEGIDEA